MILICYVITSHSDNPLRATRDYALKSARGPRISREFWKQDYGHKRARNKRIGPGGGTRRLHQHIAHLAIMGPKQDRRTSKGVAFAR